MTGPDNNIPTGQKWQECGVCGFDFPLNELISQRGVLVCSDCLDEPGVNEEEV